MPTKKPLKTSKRHTKLQTYLITGGTGFLGCHFAEYLLRLGHRVKLLDLEPLTEPALWGRVESYQGDVRNAVLVERLLTDVDVVVHAAMALPLAKPNEILSTGIEGTRTMLAAAHKAGVKRFIHISSTAVYGVPDHHPLYETDPMVGVGPYGHAKIEAEKLCNAYRKKGLVITTIRPKTFIGTGRLGVFQILFDWIRRGCAIPVIGSGENLYQLMDVRDLCDALYLAATAPAKAANDTYNVGAKKYGTVKADLTKLFRHAKTGSRVLPTPSKPIKGALAALEAVNLSPLYKWIYGTADQDSFVSIEKIEKQLGWKPKYSNADALISTYDWYRKHYAEYERATGITHRVAWKQGALKLARWVLQPHKLG
jgi:nucleoside-diphosphate-sugar epimerase